MQSLRESSHFCSTFFQCQSLKYDTLELLFHIGLDNNQSKERYGDAVEMFLKEYPAGTIKKKKHRLQGHVYLSN